MNAHKKRKYFRRKFKRYRSVTNQYFRAKLDRCLTICFPSDQSGAASFLIDQAHVSNISLRNLITADSVYVKCKDIFNFIKIKGVALEWTPSPRTFSNLTVNEGVVAAAYTNDYSLGFFEIQQCNKSVLCGPFYSRKYINLGSANGWISIETTEDLKGFICCDSNFSSTRADGLSGTLKVSIYVIFKNNLR